METEARRNSRWIGSVVRLLRDGYGVEDIAVMLRCDAQAVRDEVAILREEGRLNAIYYGKARL